MKKSFVLIVALLFAVITGSEYGVFYHYDHLLGGNVQIIKKTQPKPNAVPEVKNVQVLDDNTQLLALSQHADMVAWVDVNNTVHVWSLADNKSVLDTPLTDHAVYLDWIGDDSLFIGTASNGKYAKDLTLSTLSLSTQSVREIKKFSGLSATSTFQQITFSPFTNQVYILIGNKYGRDVYHFDTNGTMSTTSVGGRLVQNLAVAQTSDQLYIEDIVGTQHNTLVRVNQQPWQIVQRNSVILRTINNTLYYGVLDGNGQVTAVNTYQIGSTNADTAGGNATGSTSGSTGTSGVSTPSTAEVVKLDTPTAGEKLFVTDDGHVIVVSQTGYEDMTTHKTVTLKPYKSLVVRNNALFVTHDDGTMTVVTHA